MSIKIINWLKVIYMRKLFEKERRWVEKCGKFVFLLLYFFLPSLSMSLFCRKRPQSSSKDPTMWK
jgi:hypothetical protein